MRILWHSLKPASKVGRWVLQIGELYVQHMHIMYVVGVGTSTSICRSSGTCEFVMMCSLKSISFPLLVSVLPSQHGYIMNWDHLKALGEIESHLQPPTANLISHCVEL